MPVRRVHVGDRTPNDLVNGIAMEIGVRGGGVEDLLIHGVDDRESERRGGEQTAHRSGSVLDHTAATDASRPEVLRRCAGLLRRMSFQACCPSLDARGVRGTFAKLATGAGTACVRRRMKRVRATVRHILPVHFREEPGHVEFERF
jgi:hypothetical protein